ncbi:MAG TPA: hypothetical protein VHQ65_15360 [Thermoanaerobaculia bacterium]|nr:hypothetical protein [Thermoanaerobaculia bacterium]
MAGPDDSAGLDNLAPLDRLAPEAAPGIRLLPIAHDRLESALVARSVLDRLGPAGVAVELPTTLAAAAEQAVARLPRISIVVSEEPGEEALVWVCAPGDPIAEALRWAREHGVPRFFVDPDLPYAGRHPDPVPDPWAVWEVGPQRFFSLLAEAAGAAPAGEDDERREAGMAWHLRQAAEEAGGPLLALVGAAHLRRLTERLARPAAIPFARTRRTHVEVRHLHPESLTGLLHDSPLVHAAWELLRGGEPPEPVELAATLARRLSLIHGGFTVHRREEEPWGGERRRAVARYAAQALARPAPDGTLPGSGTPSEVFAETSAAEANAPDTASPAAPLWPDRAALGGVLWQIASRSWSEQTHARPAPWQRRLFFDFARRYARTTGHLVPGLYAWVVAARGVADDNLAWEVFEVARCYPWQEERAEIATARLDGEDLDLGTRTVRFRRRFFRVKQRPIRVPVRERPVAPDDPAEWLEAFDGESLCSYPPEDLVIEDYGRYLRQKAAGVVAAESERVEPFSTGLLDGIDVRETLRHLDDDRVWVRELGRSPGEAGAVVVIFDPDTGPSPEYPYLMTWHGEHDQESDMCFYSTHPAEQVVGPGILRATYGGFLMTWPRGRLFDPWLDPDYRRFHTKPERLLAAAVDYSPRKLITHVAAAPPPEPLRRRAAAQGKRIVHVPLGSLSPQTIRMVRVVHVLAGHDKRAIARRYV